MTDITALQSEILGQVSSAADEAQLEAVRVAALGKKGSVSALLATMGGLLPDERKIKGPQFNGLKDAVTEAIVARKAQLGDTALEARLASEKLDVTLPARPEKAAPSIPSPRCWKKSSRSSPTWASASPKGRTSNMTITTSPS